MKCMNLSAFKTLKQVYFNWDEILQCEYMSNYADCLYIKAVSKPENSNLFIELESGGSVLQADLDRICEVFNGFGWSMGELFLYRKLIGVPLEKKD